MEIYKKVCTILLISSCISSAIISAEASSFSIGAKVGSLGLGVESRVPLQESFRFRFGGNMMNLNLKEDSSESSSAKSKAPTFSASLKSYSVPLMLDFHPFTNSGFRLSGGLALVENKIEVAIKNYTVNVQGLKLNSEYMTFNGTEYNLANIQSMSAKFQNKNKISPIVSVGYDGSLSHASGCSFDVELGIMYTDIDKIDVSVSGPLAQDPKFIEDFKASVTKSTDTARKIFKFYPVFSVGIKYSF